MVASPFGSTVPPSVAPVWVMAVALPLVATGADGVVNDAPVVQVVLPGGSDVLTAQSL